MILQVNNYSFIRIFKSGGFSYIHTNQMDQVNITSQISIMKDENGNRRFILPDQLIVIFDDTISLDFKFHLEQSYCKEIGNFDSIITVQTQRLLETAICLSAYSGVHVYPVEIFFDIYDCKDSVKE